MMKNISNIVYLYFKIVPVLGAILEEWMFVVSLGSSASLCFLLSLWGDAVPWLQYQKKIKKKLKKKSHKSFHVDTM